jgi:hypothetical protein
MKRIAIILFLLMNLLNLFSKETIPKNIERVAINFMIQRVPHAVTIKSTEEITFNGEPVYYIVNFVQGGWILISASKNIMPILGYGTEGEFVNEDEKPVPLKCLLNDYKEKIILSKEIETSDENALKRWEELEYSDGQILKTYTPGTILLNTTRGHARWGQQRNNNLGCTPSYNQACGSSGVSDGCECGHKPVGCGAVSIGQIMWYWEWPFDFNWQNIPDALFNTTDEIQAHELATLLRDLGSAMDMTYWCSGSWTTMNKVEGAFNYYDYNSAEKKVRKNWPDGAWYDLIRTEIDCERPVLYRGDKSDLSTEKHFWVLDGYDALDPNLFHMNWGWRGSFNGFFSLNDLTPSSSNFNKNQMAIVGVSPSYNEIPNNIFDVSYQTVSDTKLELAHNMISLPYSGKSLTVNPGGELTFSAKNKIILKPGFVARSGSDFRANTQTSNFIGDDCGMQLLQIENAIIKDDPDPKYSLFTIQTSNVNSYEIIVENRWNNIVYQGAGLTDDDGYTNIWDGSGADLQAVYMGYITLRNNCGEKIVRMQDITVILGGAKSTFTVDAIGNENDELIAQNNSENELNIAQNFVVYPNPNNGKFSIGTSNSTLPYDLRIYNMLGQLIYIDKNVRETNHWVNLETIHKGIAIVDIISDNKRIQKQLIIE